MEAGSSIYQLYVNNGCRLGFFVRRDTWQMGRYAKVIDIELVKEGDMIDSTPHNWVRAKKTSADRMWPPLVTLEADWLIGGVVEIDSGGEFCWDRYLP